MNDHSCPDCTGSADRVSRRDFVRVVGAAAAISATPLGSLSSLRAEEKTKPAPESLVKVLHDTLTPTQRDEICFPWDHTDDRGLLRTHVSNNWNITDPTKLNIGSDFFTADQHDLIRQIFLGLYNPDWHERIMKQLKDDAGGYGKSQTIALFGTPGSGQFEFVMTGRHLTIRCDGDSTPHVAFGGPIFYGHAATDFNEPVGHPGNVYWHQAQKANKLFQMLDGKQRGQALVETAPPEAKVEFKGSDGKIAGVPISELSSDQKAHAKDVLLTLLEPYRQADRTEAAKLLEAQGGLDACRLAFFRNAGDGKSLDLGDDGEWDVWRLEGPSFVWHFRGVPHVHVWVNVADDASVKLNAKG
ncbi:MAG: DUF3500 domain-containing protein [Planctomycetaceae bacterium]|nr:DUF3500 domain-containing protein [Planctomycetaceae bacterium]